MSDAVDAYLDQHADEAQDLLTRLCRQPSVAAQGLGMAEMADLTESLLRDAGFATRRLHAEGAPPAIFGELRGRSPYTVLLYDHYDVQPAEPLELWNSPPFEPTVRDGAFYARGASDDKGEIAARLAAIRALRAGGEMPITLKWLIEGEEEIGSPHFEDVAGRYAGLLAADGCLWEGTGFNAAGQPVLTLGTKGLLYVQLDAHGASRDAHSGNAPILPSPVWRLVQALATLRGPDGRVHIPGFYDTVRSPAPAELQALADQPERDAELREVFGVERFVDDLSGAALLERLAFAPTCNIAGLLSGYTGEGAKTVLPAHAMAKIDFRLVPHQDPRAIVGALRAHLDARGYGDVELTVFSAAEPVVTPLTDPFVQRVLAIAERFSGKQAAITPIAGGTLPFLGPLKRHVGVPGLSAPGDPLYWGSGAHAPNEHIRLDDLRQAVRFNAYLFRALGA